MAHLCVSLSSNITGSGMRTHLPCMDVCSCLPKGVAEAVAAPHVPASEQRSGCLPTVRFYASATTSTFLEPVPLHASCSSQKAAT